MLINSDCLSILPITQKNKNCKKLRMQNLLLKLHSLRLPNQLNGLKKKFKILQKVLLTSHQAQSIDGRLFLISSAPKPRKRLSQRPKISRKFKSRKLKRRDRQRLIKKRKWRELERMRKKKLKMKSPLKNRQKNLQKLKSPMFKLMNGQWISKNRWKLK